LRGRLFAADATTLVEDGQPYEWNANLHRIEEGRARPTRIQLGPIRVRQMDHRNRWRFVDADEEDIIAILPPRNGSHVSTSQGMPRP